MPQDDCCRSEEVPPKAGPPSSRIMRRRSHKPLTSDHDPRRYCHGNRLQLSKIARFQAACQVRFVHDLMEQPIEFDEPVDYDEIENRPAGDEACVWCTKF